MEAPTVRLAARKFADVVVGLTAGVVVFAAVPSVLVLLVGDPLPSHWTGAALVSLHGLFEVLSVVVWCSWAICAWSLLHTVVVRVRTCDTSATPRLVDQLAVRIAVAILAIAPAGLASAGAASAAIVEQPPAASAPPSGHVTPAPGVGTRIPAPVSSAETTARHRSVSDTVGPGQSLWRIAKDRYGDGAAWQAIATANLGHVMGDGARFVDPSQVREGWVLTVPPLDATEPAPTPGDSAQERGQARAFDHRGSRRHDSAPVGRGNGSDPLPELAAVGVGSIVAALLARRARQARLLHSLARREGSLTPPPRQETVELSMALGPFDSVPLLYLVEAALSFLVDAERRSSRRLPDVQWLRAGSAGVDVRFASEPGAPPAPWNTVGPASWRLPASLEPTSVLAPDDTEPLCPVLVPVGDTDDITWLLPILAGGCLAVRGPLAGQLVHAMEVAASRWTWHEVLLVTDDVDAALEALGVSTGTSGRRDGGQHVLFVGDPHAIPTRARARCSVLTTEISVDADVSVFVDQRGATVHPYGIALRPHLLDASWADPIAELAPASPTVTGPPAPKPPETARTGDHLDDADIAQGSRASLGVSRDNGARQPRPLRDAGPPGARVVTARVNGPVATASRPLPQFERGAVDVRLLVSVPSIEGLFGELPPKRARRATELIAYLALHSPEPVTGDRLRSRVLGSADADAAAKTLFNTVHAARRALGLASDGAPLLPPATRAGHYQLSPLVTVDARRAAALVEAGLGDRPLDESLDLLERGLALVEGEPLGGVLTGYGWWRAEGHERHVADLVVDGACALTRGALAAGQVDRARSALARARQVEPYSEALTRAAMEIAAASGDVARLRVEWLDCRRQVDELDPGGVPSASTERLYAHLRAQLAIGERPHEAAART